MTATTDQQTDRGLSLQPFRGLRPRVDSERLGRLLCPPYDVIDPATRERLLAADADNAVAVVLPEPTAEGYAEAAERLAGWVSSGLYAVDDEPTLYVYELRDHTGATTRGLLGAVELRPAEDGVILPHENTMAGPVADRLEVMTATGADLEPIYLVYDGGGPASELLRSVDNQPAVAETVTPDGLRHRLWAITDSAAHRTVSDDLASRRALIADGHHRYATYQERQRRQRATDGPGPWDRGLALVVDSSEYGPQVHAIHRLLHGITLTETVERLSGWAEVTPVDAPLGRTLDELGDRAQFTAILSDGAHAYLVSDDEHRLADAAARPGAVDALTELDVTVAHRGLVERALRLADDEANVGYAHSLEEAVAEARENGGVALLLRPTPVAAVAAVAAAGARMPRKSTLFTPKPASGLVMRRLADQSG
ncbi:MAG TPA: DUF1015 domain-containing protein [Jatrophihabitans sp.]|nr:DUF1015 domain-containing protein [Jatrophihabitans sp.]